MCGEKYDDEVRSMRHWDRIEEPCFLKEEKQKKLEELFESEIDNAVENRHGSQEEIPEEGVAGTKFLISILITAEVAEDRGVSTDMNVFEMEMENQRQRMKVHKVHHTAIHSLQSALKKVVGQETSQTGSLVVFDSLRFDFVFNHPLHDGELEEIECLINVD